MRTYISQGLSGSETSLISAYSFDNSINDLNTTNANNLTANNSAVATNADSPFANAVSAGLQEYAEIQSVSFSTNTTVNVRVPDVSMIPTSGGISNVYYAVGANPYGLPYFSNVIGDVIRCSDFQTTSTTSTDVLGVTTTIYIPANSKIRVSLQGNRRFNTTAGNSTYLYIQEDGVLISSSLTAEDSASANQTAFTTRVLSTTTGNHTYKATFFGDGAGTTKQLSGDTGSPIQLIIEKV
jgi:hypothetical protein